jgi:hypothetical protein
MSCRKYDIKIRNKPSKILKIGNVILIKSIIMKLTNYVARTEENGFRGKEHTGVIEA